VAKTSCHHVKKTRQEIKKQVERLVTTAEKIQQCSQLKGTFRLRSGMVSCTYFDKYQFEADPVLLREICLELIKLFPEDVEAVAGLELGGIPIVTAISQITGLPVAFVRKERKQYGTCRYIEGTDLAKKRFVLVEDVISTGGAIRAALDIMQDDRLAPCQIVGVVDRMLGGCQTISTTYGIPCVCLCAAKELDGELTIVPVTR
jgi:orotate phosphoribosyltransferase